MNALMFGWEFPPHILGGLGTASYGLTKGMSKQGDMNITFVIPHPHGDEDQSFLHIIGANNVPIVWKENSWDHVNSRIGKTMHPDEYFQLRDNIRYDFRRIGTDELGCVNFSGVYPKNLMEEISNYEAVASVNYTYMLECADGTLYTGWTNDLAGRLATHNAGKGAKYTRVRLPVKLVYAESHMDRCDAMRREYQIKQLSRREKLALLETGSNIVNKL